jgi:hypothetical protein
MEGKIGRFIFILGGLALKIFSNTRCGSRNTGKYKPEDFENVRNLSEFVSKF